MPHRLARLKTALATNLTTIDAASAVREGIIDALCAWPERAAMDAYGIIPFNCELTDESREYAIGLRDALDNYLQSAPATFPESDLIEILKTGKLLGF